VDGLCVDEKILQLIWNPAVGKMPIDVFAGDLDIAR